MFEGKPAPHRWSSMHDDIEEALSYQRIPASKAHEGSFGQSSQRQSSYHSPEVGSALQDSRQDTDESWSTDRTIMDDESFFRVARNLLDLYMTKGMTEEQAIESVLVTARLQQAFRAALLVQSSNIPMFRESGETSEPQLIRNVEAVFGQALRDFETLDQYDDPNPSHAEGRKNSPESNHESIRDLSNSYPDGDLDHSGSSPDTSEYSNTSTPIDQLRVAVDWNMVTNRLDDSSVDVEAAYAHTLHTSMSKPDYAPAGVASEHSAVSALLRHSPNPSFKLELASRKSSFIQKQAEAESLEADVRTNLEEEIRHVQNAIVYSANTEEYAEYDLYLRELQFQLSKLKKKMRFGRRTVERAARLMDGEQLESKDHYTHQADGAYSTTNTKRHSMEVFEADSSTGEFDRDRNDHRKTGPRGKKYVGWKVSANGRSVQVLAPENLPEGFQFEARVDDEVFLATVPPGGVQKGQVFVSKMRDIYGETAKRSREFLNMNSPHFAWRTRLWDCFHHGVGHPFLWNTLFCPHVALYQVMVRLRLSPTGNRKAAIKPRTRLSSIVWLTILVVLLHLCFGAIWGLFQPTALSLVIASLALASLDVVLALHFLCMVSRTRHVVRRDYDIPDALCGDNCMAIFCTCCTLTQMGYHTADYDTYRGYCCTDTGLAGHVEVKLPLDNMNRFRVAAGVPV